MTIHDTIKQVEEESVLLESVELQPDTLEVLEKIREAKKKQDAENDYDRAMKGI